ncbi:MAG: type II toxin-antitoxin system VapC family toxin [Longispora sp.]|nr:type II toxin-antitoxin system VapC family toxin [Longispora sp. (in: high G+C Gram-positive bacteria)]
MIIVDTNVLSELMRPSPSSTVIAWVGAQTSDELYATSITLAEIHYGIQRLPNGRRKDLLNSTASEVFNAFTERILPFDAAAAIHYATIVNDRDQAGLPIDGFDAQIAAICRAHEATLATRNVKDFTQTGINIIDPWQQS